MPDRVSQFGGWLTRRVRRRRIAWLRRKALEFDIQSLLFGGDVWGVLAANNYRRNAREMRARADALEATLRRGEATNREAQAPLPASVSATREGSQRDFASGGSEDRDETLFRGH